MLQDDDDKLVARQNVAQASTGFVTPLHVAAREGLLEVRVVQGAPSIAHVAKMGIICTVHPARGDHSRYNGTASISCSASMSAAWKLACNTMVRFIKYVPHASGSRMSDIRSCVRLTSQGRQKSQ